MKHSSKWLATVVGLAAIAATAVALPAQAAPVDRTPSRYLVRTDSARSAAVVARDLRRGGADVGHVYSAVLPGLSARLTADQVRTLRSRGSVESVIPDPVFHSTTVQTNPTWGLDRIDQRKAAGSTTYRYDTTGRGVTAFVVDTGIRMRHSQFGSRALSGIDLVDGDDDASDCEGHGTHVAGTVGGSTYGVAKAVTLVGVRVLDCEGSGYASDIIAGLDWVVSVRPSGPSVVNLSLVAAGNDDANA
jgi:subtilisin family serine protease